MIFDKWIRLEASEFVHSYRKKVLKRNAVYAIYGNDELVYVGQSSNLKNRIFSHKLHLEITGQCYFRDRIFSSMYFKVKYPSKYGKESMIEKRLIKKLAPPMNKRAS
jgi:predicted GIY-YIG superfamily endonuclease